MSPSRRTLSRHERLNDPERPTTLSEVVDDIVAEERERKQARSKGRFLPPIVADPCSARPTANEGHWWVYPPQGVRGRARCKFCGEGK